VKISIKFILVCLFVIILMIAAILLIIPYETILNYIVNNTIYFSVIAGSAIISYLLIFILLFLNISRPIKKISEAVKIINKEETENLKSILPERSDELGKLSDLIREHHKNIRFNKLL